MEPPPASPRRLARARKITLRGRRLGPVACPFALPQRPPLAVETACGTSAADCTGDWLAARMSGLRSVPTVCTGSPAAAAFNAARKW